MRLRDEIRYFLPRRYHAFMGWVCTRLGHDWTEWTYHEDFERGEVRYRHHNCLRCNMSATVNMTEEFPSGVWVESLVTDWNASRTRGKIVGVNRRRVP